MVQSQGYDEGIKGWNQHSDSHTKKLKPQISNPCSEMIDVEIHCEADEQCSFVGSKKSPHWLWYALDSKREKVLAYVFGPRTDATCRRLLRLQPTCSDELATRQHFCGLPSSANKRTD